MNEDTPKSTWIDRFKKMGIVAFLFFFIKGLVWLAIFFGLGKWLKRYILNQKAVSLSANHQSKSENSQN